MQINKLMKLGKKLAVVATVAMTMAMPLTAYAAPANFNAAYYAAKNPDVVKVYGSSYEALAKHYDTFGMLEGRDAFAGDTKAAFIRLANAHYTAGSGLAKVFDAKWYAKMNPDAVKVFGNDPRKLYEHFIIYGLAEGRVPSENFNAQEFFSENAALAVVVAKAFADVPTTSANSFVQVAKQVSDTVNAVYADPVNTVITETTNNTENTTPSNNSSSNEESTTNNKQTVTKLQTIKQMTAQATAATTLLTSQATSMTDKANDAQTKIAAIKAEMAQLGGNMTQDQRDEFERRINEVMGLADSAIQEAIILSNTAKKAGDAANAGYDYAYRYYNELNSTKNALTSNKEQLEIQKGLAEAAFAKNTVEFEGATAALYNAQAALDNAKEAYADALAAVATLTGQKASQANVAAQADEAAAEAQIALSTAQAELPKNNKEFSDLIDARNAIVVEYASMTPEEQASPEGVSKKQEIDRRFDEYMKIADELTATEITEYNSKKNAADVANAELTNITNQLAAAEENVTTTNANVQTAEANLAQAKDDYLDNLDAQIASTTEAITQVENTMTEVRACGEEMLADRNADEAIANEAGNILGTEENPSIVKEAINEAEEARVDLHEATIVPPATPDEESLGNTSENNSSNQD